MADPSVCASCGASIPSESAFCPRCGTKVPIDELLSDTDPMMVPAERAISTQSAAPRIPDPVPAPAVPPPPAQSATPPVTVGPAAHMTEAPTPQRAWWVFGVPIAVLACALILWAVVMGMPFSRDQGPLVRAAGPAGDTVGEGGGQTATVTQLGEPGGVASSTAGRATVTSESSTADNTATTSLVIPSQLPPQVPPQVQPSAPMTPPIFAPPLSAPREPAPGSMATPGRPAQAPPPAMPPAPVIAPRQPPARAAQISESDAIARLKSFVISKGSYDVPGDCIDVRSLGYKNVGYTLNVVDLCGPDPRSLGYWRVDALTREVFREGSDGHYRRP